MRNIPFSPPDITDEEIEAVTDVLRSGWITTGPKTKEFEKKISEYCGTEKTICLNSATACMEMCLRMLGIGPGDEVITSAYTYTASASVIAHVGAKIVLVDTAKDSFHLSYSELEKAITPKTKAIIPVDIGGVMCDYDTIFKILEDKKQSFQPNNEIQKLFGRVIVLADAAHSFGASCKNGKSGSVADFTSFSFHAVKNLTTAEGGALTWKSLGEELDAEIYNKLNTLSLHGQTKDALAKNKLGSWEYDIVSPAYKCNMTDIQAAIGSSQLRRYEGVLEKRKKIIHYYDKNLDSIAIKSLPHYDNMSKSSGHLYMINLIGKTTEKRNQFIANMALRGIACNVHYKPLPMLTAYRSLGYSIVDYPNACQLFENEVTLPLHTLLSDGDVKYIVENVNKLI